MQSNILCYIRTIEKSALIQNGLFRSRVWRIYYSLYELVYTFRYIFELEEDDMHRRRVVVETDGGNWFAAAWNRPTDNPFITDGHVAYWSSRFTVPRLRFSA